MLAVLRSFFSGGSFGAAELKSRKPGYVYRDDLAKKPSQKKKLLRRRAKAGEAKPLLERRDRSRETEEKVGFRVKVVMTKAEAARFLSNCKDGRVIEFKDVADQLVQIPAARFRVVSSAGNCRDTALQSVPEEPSTVC